MPHLIIEYTPGSVSDLDINTVCQKLREQMSNIDIFPLAGIRVRAYQTSAYSMADGNTDNQFVALTLRVGQGRSQEQLHQAGQLIFKTAQQIFAKKLANGNLALSQEIVEINSQLSWKDNPLHARLLKDKK